MPGFWNSVFDVVGGIRWSLLALLLLLLLNSFWTPGFFTMEVRDGRLYGVVIDILNHGAKTAIVALGMTLVIASGGVDLSVGSVMAISGAVLTTTLGRAELSAPLAIVLALLAGVVAGLWNGALVSYLRLQPIVATLILMVAGRGVAQLCTDGSIVTFEHGGLAMIGNGAVLGLPFPVTLLAMLLMLTTGVMRMSAARLMIEALGDNERAARMAGVPVERTKLAVYAYCGFCAAIAGLIECSYIKAADANNAGQLMELDAILAVVIGGTALGGGRFRLLGTIVGALLMQTLTKTLYMHDVSAQVAPAPKAAAVILVCLLQSPRTRNWFARRRRVPA